MSEPEQKQCCDDRPNYQAEGAWHELIEEVREGRRVTGSATPAITVSQLRKHWHKATGWMPPEEK